MAKRAPEPLLPLQLGVGLGANINFSQAGRAYDNSVRSMNEFGQYIVNRFLQAPWH